MSSPLIPPEGTVFQRLVVDRGNVEIDFPDDWEVHAEEAGHMRIEPADERVRLELSYAELDAPSSPVERLREILRKGLPQPHDDALVHVVDHPSLRLCWADYPFERPDVHGARRLAHGRWLVATNGLLQVLVSYHYWDDDAGWAVRTWDAIVPTLRLDRGRPAGGPPGAKVHYMFKRPG